MRQILQQALAFLPVVAALAISSGCGSEGSSEPASTISLSGTVDAGYGSAGRIAVAGGSIAVDSAGNVFVGDLVVTKFNAAGSPAGDFVDGAPAPAAQTHVVVDLSGNVYSVYAVADGHFVLVKRDATGWPVESFGQAGRVDLNAVRSFVSVGDVFVDGSGNVYLDGVWIPPLSARPVFHFIIKLDSVGRQVTSFGAGTDASLEVASILELQPARTSVDAAGNIFVAYSFIPGTAVVEKFDANGQPVLGNARSCFRREARCERAPRDGVRRGRHGGGLLRGEPGRESIRGRNVHCIDRAAAGRRWRPLRGRLGGG